MHSPLVSADFSTLYIVVSSEFPRKNPPFPHFFLQIPESLSQQAASRPEQGRGQHVTRCGTAYKGYEPLAAPRTAPRGIRATFPQIQRKSAPIGRITPAPRSKPAPRGGASITSGRHNMGYNTRPGRESSRADWEACAARNGLALGRRSVYSRAHVRPVGRNVAGIAAGIPLR